MTLTNTLTPAHFEMMAELERSFYSEEFITPPEQAYAWYVRYPHTALAALDGSRVAGFVNLFPVKEPVMERLIGGLLNDRELTHEDIADIHASGTAPLHMFLCCIAVAKEYRRQRVTRALLRAAVAQYAPVADRCGQIVTDNVTAEGERFSLRYGFLPVRPSDHASRVYIQSYKSFAARVNDGPYPAQGAVFDPPPADGSVPPAFKL